MTNPIAVSTWSLHRLLGVSYLNGPNDAPNQPSKATWGVGSCSLLDLPVELAKRGFGRVEICHFHLASLDRVYLQEIASSFSASGVVIQTLLIDDGDLTSVSTYERDKAWIVQWLQAAADIGAENARIIAGKSRPNEDALATAAASLRELAMLAKSLGVRPVTENWFDLLSTPQSVHRILDSLGDDLGFLADTGNWHGPSKYRDLESIFKRAELCHAKCSFDTGFSMDRADFGHSIDAALCAEYRGPFTLIYDGPDDDEWAALDMERDFVLGKLAKRSN